MKAEEMRMALGDRQMECLATILAHGFRLRRCSDFLADDSFETVECAPDVVINRIMENGLTGDSVLTEDGSIYTWGTFIPHIDLRHKPFDADMLQAAYRLTPLTIAFAGTDSSYYYLYGDLSNPILQLWARHYYNFNDVDIVHQITDDKSGWCGWVVRYYYPEQ